MDNNKNFLPQKKINKKNNIITSLNEVESFLRNLNHIFSSAQLIKLFKKFK